MVGLLRGCMAQPAIHLRLRLLASERHYANSITGRTPALAPCTGPKRRAIKSFPNVFLAQTLTRANDEDDTFHTNDPVLSRLPHIHGYVFCVCMCLQTFKPLYIWSSGPFVRGKKSKTNCEWFNLCVRAFVCRCVNHAPQCASPPKCLPGSGFIFPKTVQCLHYTLFPHIMVVKCLVLKESTVSVLHNVYIYLDCVIGIYIPK